MLTVLMATALIGQYPTPQSTYGIPAQYVYGTAPQAQPQAYMVVQPGPMGRFLGTVGERLIRCSWPRLQPMATHAAQPAIVYLVAQQQQQLPVASYQLPVGMPSLATGNLQLATSQAAYGQAQIQMAAPRPSEGVPPVPPR
jgi:hypothetical protein